MEVLENNFGELMDLGFTAHMDEALDRISEGKDDSKRYLKEFFMGSDEKMGLHQLVEERAKEIPYPNFIVGDHPDTGEAIIVRNGKDGGSFIQVGEGESRRFADVPEDMAPADLTLEKALELLAQRRAPAESVGVHPQTGRNLILRNKGGFYLEVERTPEEIEAKEKPTWISVPPGSDPRTMSQDDLDFLSSLPSEVGKHPEDGEAVVFKIGKFGAYVEHVGERRTVDDWTEGKGMSLARSLEILAMPKGRTARVAAAPLKEFGTLEGRGGSGEGAQRSIRPLRDRWRDERHPSARHRPGSPGRRGCQAYPRRQARGGTFHEEARPPNRREEGSGKEDSCQGEGRPQEEGVTLHVLSFGSPEYDRTVELRRAVLRRPLGLEFDPDQLAAEGEDTHLALYDGDDLLACLVLSPQGEALKMRQVAVRADARGRGVGRELVRASERWAIENGFTRMTLHARQTAVPFYERLGYLVVGDPFLEIGLPHRAMRRSLRRLTPCSWRSAFGLR